MARVFFRIVHHNPVTREDMLSYVALGIPPISDDPELRRMAEGISVYATLAQARRAARAQPRLGRFIAEITIPDNGDLSFSRTGSKPGHHTIWSTNPDELADEVLECITTVMRVQS